MIEVYRIIRDAGDFTGLGFVATGSKAQLLRTLQLPAVGALPNNRPKKQKESK